MAGIELDSVLTPDTSSKNDADMTLSYFSTNWADAMSDIAFDAMSGVKWLLNSMPIACNQLHNFGL